MAADTWDAVAKVRAAIEREIHRGELYGYTGRSRVVSRGIYALAARERAGASSARPQASHRGVERDGAVAKSREPKSQGRNLKPTVRAQQRLAPDSTPTIGRVAGGGVSPGGQSEDHRSAGTSRARPSRGPKSRAGRNGASGTIDRSDEFAKVTIANVGWDNENLPQGVVTYPSGNRGVSASRSHLALLARRARNDGKFKECLLLYSRALGDGERLAGEDFECIALAAEEVSDAVLLEDLAVLCLAVDAGFHLVLRAASALLMRLWSKGILRDDLFRELVGPQVLRGHEREALETGAFLIKNFDLPPHDKVEIMAMLSGSQQLDILGEALRLTSSLVESYIGAVPMDVLRDCIDQLAVFEEMAGFAGKYSSHIRSGVPELDGSSCLQPANLSGCVVVVAGFHIARDRRLILALRSRGADVRTVEFTGKVRTESKSMERACAGAKLVIVMGAEGRQHVSSIVGSLESEMITAYRFVNGGASAALWMVDDWAEQMGRV